MPFTAEEVENIANATLDFYIRENPTSQTIQEKPLLNALWSKRKSFPGGKEAISIAVKGDYTSQLEGYSHDDEVGYANPANIKRAHFLWYELHTGIEVTLTELKKDGISIEDTMDGSGEVEHSDRELTALVDLFKDKIEDMMEGWERSLNLMLWRDGTQSAKEIPGIRYLIKNAPTSGTVAGIDQSVLTWWRNRYALGITPDGTNQTLSLRLEKEWRQLARYGGRPKLWLSGSDFLDAIHLEQKAKGVYTQTGWNKQIDVAMADASFKNNTIQYDPTLDDLGLAKYCFALDQRHIGLRMMQGEEKKMHRPARPHNKYVLYRAITTTGAMCANKLNCHEVFSIA